IIYLNISRVLSHLSFHRPRRLGLRPGNQSCSAGLGARTRPPIGEALTDDALERFPTAGAIIKAVGLPRVVPELELREVAVKVGFGAVLVHAAHTALKDAAGTFNGVRVNGAVV